ncbi:MAG: hypothetical protein ACRED3_05030 [Bradyrhizobium sp.]
MDSPVLHDEIDKLLVGERMKWQKVIAGNKIEKNRCDPGDGDCDGDRRGCWHAL